MADRLRALIDVVLGSLDESVDGASLAGRVNFSRDHLDRLLAAATGESPVALRRRLLLERAAWQLRTGASSPSEAATGAGYGSLAAFSRAFARAYGGPPSSYTGEVPLPAPNTSDGDAPPRSCHAARSSSSRRRSATGDSPVAAASSRSR
jgi:transcriptional regulator GlxA family with amidase domain